MTIDNEEEGTPRPVVVAAVAVVEVGLLRPADDVPEVKASVQNRGGVGVAVVPAVVQNRGVAGAPSPAQVEVVLANEGEDGWNGDTPLKVDQVANIPMMAVVSVPTATESSILNLLANILFLEISLQ